MAIEIYIALFVHNGIVRFYLGDILVVILLYTLVRGLLIKPLKWLPIYLFLLAAGVEFAQYLHVVKMLGQEDNKILSTIFGSSFDIKDILCYLTTAAGLLIWEKIRGKTGMDAA